MAICITFEAIERGFMGDPGFKIGVGVAVGIAEMVETGVVGVGEASGISTTEGVGVVSGEVSCFSRVLVISLSWPLRD